MSESPGLTNPINYASPMPRRKNSLVHIGGALGIAASVIGMMIFLIACAGFNAALTLSFLPILLSLPGLVLTIVGGLFQKDVGLEDTAVLSAMFVNAMGLIGGVVEVAAWRGWPIFAGQGGT